MTEGTSFFLDSVFLSLPLSGFTGLGRCSLGVWPGTHWNTAFPGHTMLPIPVHLGTQTGKRATHTAVHELEVGSCGWGRGDGKGPINNDYYGTTKTVQSDLPVTRV